jgi:hypothetical protein
MNSVIELKKLYNSSAKLIENMKNVYNNCNEEDLNNGKDWYKRANLFCLNLSEKYKISPLKVSGIISALSPQKSWENNMLIAEEFIRTNGVVTRHTFMQTSKARKILRYAKTTNDVENCLGGLKTINFFNNIYNPHSKKYVTVDRHHLYLSIGIDIQGCTPKQYNFIKENTIIFANELDIIPNELQSTLWVCWKRIKKYEKETYS